MKLFQKILFSFLVIVSITSCSERKTEIKNTIGMQSYPIPIEELEAPFKFRKLKPNSCGHEVIKDLNIEIDFHNKALLQNKDISLMIVEDTTYYKGEFREKILIKNMKMCMDDYWGSVFSLMFGIVDKKNKKLYIWSIKDNYDLINVKTLKVRLDWDNSDGYTSS